MQEYLTSVSFTAKALRSAALAAAIALIQPAAGAAQGLFAPAVTVNETVITNFELEQRALFIRLIGTPGDPLKLARQALIDDRLKEGAITAAGIAVSDEEIQLGLEELAGRANMTLDQFLAALAEAGVSQETVRDYTASGLGWRDYVGARFLSQARPSEEEIDRAMGSAGSGGIEVALAELIMPLTPENAAQVQDIANQVSQITDYKTFSDAARQLSAAQSRDKGGVLDWLPIGKLPPALQETVLSMSPGEVTDPIGMQGAVALFQARGVRETAAAEPAYAAIEYAAYRIAGGRSAAALATAAEVTVRADTCNDFYGIAQGQPPEVLEIASLPPSQIPQDIAVELAKLDPGETSTVLTRGNGQTLLVLMLCGRTAALSEDASREAVANALTQQRLAALSSSYLAQLRAEAVITTP